MREALPVRSAAGHGTDKIGSMPHETYPLALLCHPATPAPQIARIEAAVTFSGDRLITFRYCLWGDMARLRIPPERAPERTDLLWEHNCFEAFVGLPGETAYREFNFSPSGQWAAYAFSDYRRRAPDSFELAPPQIFARTYAGRLELDAVLDLRALPENPGNTPWQIALNAVVEAADTVDGSHSYWALHHASSRPDFHQRAGFTFLMEK